MKVFSYILLLVSGLVLTFPTLYESMSGLTGDSPVIQIVLGVVSVLVALYLLFTPSR